MRSSAGRRSTSRPVGAADRRHAILARVADEQTIHVGELARQLGCSEMTIRRDIRRLERDGFVRQTYGGATAHITRSFDISFNARALLAGREKRLIGMRSAALVEDARVVFVGIGSTAEQFAQYLPARRDLMIVTASLPIASLLGTRPVRVVTVGRFRPPGRADLRGPDRHRDPVAVSIRRRGDRRGGHLGTVGHHRADRGRGRGAARGTRTNRARDRHRRRLEGRRRDARSSSDRRAGSRPS